MKIRRYEEELDEEDIPKSVAKMKKKIKHQKTNIWRKNLKKKVTNKIKKKETRRGNSRRRTKKKSKIKK